MIITGDGSPLEISIERNSIDITFETTPTGVLLVPVAGRDGTSISIAGMVATYADLPSGLGVADKGSLYIVQADGLGYVWSGTAWPADGAGVQIRGPQGEQGIQGVQGIQGDQGIKGDTGDTGPAGPANTLTIGTVTGGVSAAASITGTAPSQTLNMTLPKGDKGDKGDTGDVGPAGPANTLTVGTVTSGAAAASITGTAPNQTLNLVLQKGDQGEKGDTGEVSTSQLNTALSTKADLVGGTIPQAQLPAVAVVEFLGAVDSQAAMLDLTGQRGDWCTRTDLGTDWQVIAEPSSTLANWRERTYPASPVSSVAGRTGTVTLSTNDITDMTAVGKDVAKATSAEVARTAIGAGTSSLTLGTSASTAAAGNDARLSDTRTPTDGSVTNAKVASGATIALSKLAAGYMSGSDNVGARTLTVWVGTEAQYTAITTKDANTLYFRSA